MQDLKLMAHPINIHDTLKHVTKLQLSDMQDSSVHLFTASPVVKPTDTVCTALPCPLVPFINQIFLSS
jgi:hypothetical protein